MMRFRALGKRSEKVMQPKTYLTAPSGRRHWPRLMIDLSRPKHRLFLVLGLAGMVILAIVTILGSFVGYHYGESAHFCGTICHPMESTLVRYERSPHANIECGKCHIGEGASFFVKSKISGLKQVLPALQDAYSRPIKGPIHNLRPARETCETCHTPAQFDEDIIKTITHYENDAANTPVRTTLILKMGGWKASTGASEGVHWHTTNPVYYIAADHERQVIMWVGAQQADGSIKEYFARDMLDMVWQPVVDQARADGRIRLLDCIDCHNRSGHHTPTPETTVDEAISAGLISTDLPYIRAKAVELLTPSYPSQAAAFAAIEGLRDFYLADGRQMSAERQAKVDAAIVTLQEIFAQTHFPEMKMNWRVNPDNSKHDPFLGCFRCHDNRHVALDEAGNQVDAISANCNLCHTVPIFARGENIPVEAPVIVGKVPSSHVDYRWTIEHRAVAESSRQECHMCHGRGFCSNEICHNLSHPPEMLYHHPDEFHSAGSQVCFACHQDIYCTQCHSQGHPMVTARQDGENEPFLDIFHKP